MLTSLQQRAMRSPAIVTAVAAATRRTIAVASTRMQLAATFHTVPRTNGTNLRTARQSGPRGKPASDSASVRCMHAATHTRAEAAEEPPKPEITDYLVNQYADKKARSVSIQDMINMGSKPAYLLTAAQWLWAEIPVRLAKRLRDLDDLPFGLSKSAEIQHLSHMYRLSLQDALAFPCPTNSAEELAFTERVVKRLLVRHQETVVDLASGINGGFLGRIPMASASVSAAQSSASGLSGASRPLKAHFLLQEFLDKFNSARIGLRLLLAQHAALHSNTNASPSTGKFVGVIELNCNPARIVSQAVEDASVVCRSQHGLAPTVEIHDQSAAAGGMKDFHYVTAHLRCMIFELLKNAMKATVQHAKRKLGAGQTLQEKDLPPIQVVLVDGATDVTIKVSDRGGGFKRSELPLVFTYTYSATQKTLKQTQAIMEQARQQREAAANAAPDSAATSAAGGASAVPSLSSSSPDAACLPKASRGWLTGENFHPTLNIAVNDFGEAFGLPITRLYARYCGGDLQLFSLANHGTDAYLYLGKPSLNYHEVIPD